MVKLTLWERLYKYVSVAKYVRQRAHYDAIREDLSLRGHDKMEAEYFSRRFEHYHRRVLYLAKVRILFYAILFATLLVNLLKAIPFLAFLVTFIELGSSIIGTTLASVVVFFITVRINLSTELMNECLMHLVALYHKNPKRDTKKALARISRMM